VGTLADWVGTALDAGVIAAMIVLVRIALAAERGRADDWRTAAQTQSAANEVHSANIAKLIGSVEQLTVSQREVLALLQSQAASSQRRDAA
jgi:hypothetical protein